MSADLVLASSTGELYPPVQYSGWWVALAFGIIAAGVLLVWLVLLLTRPRRAVASAPVATPSTVSAAIVQLRGEYLDRIGGIEESYRTGGLDARRANLELSRAVRAYVNEYSGLEAPVLTLDELVDRGVHPSLVDALKRHYYPSVFRRGAIIDPVAGAAAAREVLSSWR